jgi:hypothetical protein
MAGAAARGVRRAVPTVWGRSVKALLLFCLAPSLSQYFWLAEDIGGICLPSFLLS